MWKSEGFGYIRRKQRSKDDSIQALIDGLRQELRPFGVKVVAVEPGDVQTNTNRNTVFDMKHGSPYEKWAATCWQRSEDNLKKAPPPDVVAQKIYRIIRKRNPRSRYTAGDLLSMAFPFISRFVTSAVKELLVRAFYGL